MILISLKSGLFGIFFLMKIPLNALKIIFFRSKFGQNSPVTETKLFLRILINSIYGDCVPQQAVKNTSQEHLYQG